MTSKLDEEQIKNFLVNDLKEELKKRNASTSGKKSELYDRLVALIRLDNTDNIDQKDASDKSNTNGIVEEEFGRDETTYTKEKIINDNNGIENISLSDNFSKTFENDKINIEVTSTEREMDVITNTTEITLKETVKQNLIRKTNASAVEVHNENRLSSGRFVRIDNFQRPLNIKSLLKWLEENVCHFPIKEENIWINSIKTHCYIDFESNEQALQCIEKVTGLCFPATSTLKLEADFTSISAHDAPIAVEASLKPGQWKSGKESVAKGESSAAPLKRKIDDIGLAGGAMLKKAALLAATNTSRTNLSPSAQPTEGFFTRKHKLETGQPIDNIIHQQPVVDTNQSVNTHPVPSVNLISKSLIPPPPPPP